MGPSLVAEQPQAGGGEQDPARWAPYPSPPLAEAAGLGMLEAAGDAPGVQLMQAAGAGVQDAACAPWFLSPGIGRRVSGNKAGSQEPRGA